MNCMEYVDMKNANRINEESWEVLWRKLAFIEFDAALEEYVENGKEAHNDGESLMDVSTEQVGKIMERFIERVEEATMRLFAEEMRGAVQDVTGLVC